MKLLKQNVWKVGKFEDFEVPKDTSLMIADPVYGNAGMIDHLVSRSRRLGFPACVFMWPEDLLNLRYKPDQICFWIKAVSAKNTSKRYSNFVEAIAMYGVKFHRELHWSNRTGIFHDRLFSNTEHPWKKPESLIETLIRNHYSGRGTVYDPCADQVRYTLFVSG